MKKIIAILLVTAILLLAESAKTVVILPLNGQGIAAEGISILTKKLNSSLAEAGVFRVVDQEAVLEYLTTSENDSASPLSVGIAVGTHFSADYIASGTVINDNGAYFTNITLTDVAQKRTVESVNDTVEGYIRDVADKSIPKTAYILSGKEIPGVDSLSNLVGTINTKESMIEIRPYHRRSDVFMNGMKLGQGKQKVVRPPGEYTFHEVFKGEPKNSIGVNVPAEKYTEVRLGGKRARFSMTPTVSFIPNVLSITKVNDVETRETDGVFLYGGEMGFTFEDRYYFGISSRLHFSNHWFVAGAAADWKYLFKPHKYVTLGTGLSAGLYVLSNEKFPYDGTVLGKDEYAYKQDYWKGDSTIVDSLTLIEDVFTENWLIPTAFGTAEIGGDKIRFFSRVDLLVQIAGGWTSYYLKDDTGHWVYSDELVEDTLPEDVRIIDVTVSPLITAGVKILFGKNK